MNYIPFKKGRSAMLIMRIVRREEPAEKREECLLCGHDLTYAGFLAEML